MPIINKTKRTAAIYNRGREVVKVYDRGKLAWQKSSSIPDYLCFTALEAGQFTLTIPAAVTPTYLSYVEWSKDGRTWNHTDNTSEAVTIDVQVASGEKVYWRGSGQSMTPYGTAADRASRFSSTGEFDMSGHLLSLLKGSDYDNLSGIGNYTFCNLFFQSSGSLGVVHAHDLVMPPLNQTGMFFRLFRGCTSLLTAPALPQTSVPSWGFREMFYGCTSLTEIADMAATSYGGTCCQAMYQGCTSLTSVTLPTPTSYSGTGQFQLMFYKCSNLSYVKFLATDISTENCTNNWLSGVSTTGTFIQAEGVTWPRGASGIPTGWVDIEKRTMPSGYKQVEYLSNPNYGYINTNRAFEANAETLEIAFVKQATGASMVIGSTTHNYRYGSIKLSEQATALVARVGVDFSNQLQKDSSIASVSADLPHTLRYVGNASGFELYFDGVLKDTKTCAWDAVNPFSGNYLFSANSNPANTAYFHVLPVYYLKIWDSNNTLAVDYVAAIRESDNVAGFYDMANNVFHPSDNANNFTAGQEI